MDRSFLYRHGPLTLIVFFCLNSLECCSCKPIITSNNKLTRVPCVLELLVPKESKTDTTKTHLEKTVELLKDRTLWQKQLKEKEVEYLFSILCKADDTVGSDVSASTDFGANSGAPSSKDWHSVFPAFKRDASFADKQERIFKRAATYGRRGSHRLGRVGLSPRDSTSSWLWKWRGDDSKRRR